MKRVARRARRAAAGPDRGRDASPAGPPRPSFVLRVPGRRRAGERDSRTGRDADRRGHGTGAGHVHGRPEIDRRPQPGSGHGRPAQGRALQRAVSDTFASYGRYWLELFRLPRDARESVEPRFDADGWEHITTALDGGAGSSSPCPISAASTLPARGSRNEGSRRRWSSSRSSRRSCSTGSPKSARRSAWRWCRSAPTRDRPSCAPSRPTGSSACCVTVTWRVTAWRWSSSVSARRCPAARRPSPCAPARPWFRPGSTSARTVGTSRRSGRR